MGQYSDGIDTGDLVEDGVGVFDALPRVGGDGGDGPIHGRIHAQGHRDIGPAGLGSRDGGVSVGGRIEAAEHRRTVEDAAQGGWGAGDQVPGSAD